MSRSWLWGTPAKATLCCTNCPTCAPRRARRLRSSSIRAALNWSTGCTTPGISGWAAFGFSSSSAIPGGGSIGGPQRSQRGDGLQASPPPSRSESRWSGLASVGQLSQTSPTPSRSRSTCSGSGSFYWQLSRSPGTPSASRSPPWPEGHADEHDLVGDHEAALQPGLPRREPRADDLFEPLADRHLGHVGELGHQADLRHHAPAALVQVDRHGAEAAGALPLELGADLGGGPGADALGAGVRGDEEGEECRQGEPAERDGFGSANAGSWRPP